MMRQADPAIRWVMMALVLIAAGACDGSINERAIAGSAPAVSGSVEATIPATTQLLPTRRPTASPSPTALVVRALGMAPRFPDVVPTPGIRAVDAELLFPAPMPSAAEILAWRPPPVPVPYALHPNDHYWLRRPIPSGWVDYGLDWYPYGGNGGGVWRMHRGMDFANDPGTPVLAAGDGVVVWVESGWAPRFQLAEGEMDSAEQVPAPRAGGSPPLTTTATSQVTSTIRVAGPYGNLVIIRHDWGWLGQPVFTLYGHLLEIFVREGDHVSAGDLIAGVGNTGDSTGPHLHFEVRVGENHYDFTRNPALWIAPYEGWGTLAGRVTDSEGSLLPGLLVTVQPAGVETGHAADEQSTRTTTTYAGSQVNPDEQWGENFVLPDVPAGTYRVEVETGRELLLAEVTILPGVTSFLAVHERQEVTPVPTPSSSATPAPE